MGLGENQSWPPDLQGDFSDQLSYTKKKTVGGRNLLAGDGLA
jgi:hypothetical protein